MRTKKEFIKLVDKEIESLQYLNRFNTVFYQTKISQTMGKNVLGNAMTCKIGDVLFSVLSFHPFVLKAPEEIIKPLVQHEVLHCMLVEGDESPIFQEKCKELGIPLSKDEEYDNLSLKYR